MSRLSESKVSACVSESKWYFCNLAFPGCLFDKEKKIWKRVPMCRDSCLSYLSSPNCKSLIPTAHVFLALQKYCQDVADIDNLYTCPDDLSSTYSNCISNLLGKYISKSFVAFNLIVYIK